MNAGIEVPWDEIDPTALKRLVEEFVTREGTDYGRVTYDLSTKVRHVMAQLESGEAYITYDQRTGTASIAKRR